MHTRSARFAAVPLTAILVFGGAAACSDDDDGGESSATSAEDATTTTAGAGGEETAITAVDYEFEGVPETLPAGPHTFTFTNEGEEPHELVIFRIVDENESIEDILQLGEEEGQSHVEEAGGTFAEAGADGEPAEVDLEAGKYAMVCFVSVGTTGPSDAEAGDGPPHFMEGMVTEFTVE